MHLQLPFEQASLKQREASMTTGVNTLYLLSAINPKTWNDKVSVQSQSLNSQLSTCQRHLISSNPILTSNMLWLWLCLMWNPVSPTSQTRSVCESSANLRWDNFIVLGAPLAEAKVTADSVCVPGSLSPSTMLNNCAMKSNFSWNPPPSIVWWERLLSVGLKNTEKPLPSFTPGIIDRPILWLTRSVAWTPTNDSAVSHSNWSWSCPQLYRGVIKSESPTKFPEGWGGWRGWTYFLDARRTHDAHTTEDETTCQLPEPKFPLADDDVCPDPMQRSTMLCSREKILETFFLLTLNKQARWFPYACMNHG